jgi:hypothetical protein
MKNPDPRWDAGGRGRDDWRCLALDSQQLGTGRQHIVANRCLASSREGRWENVALKSEARELNTGPGTVRGHAIKHAKAEPEI